MAHAHSISDQNHPGEHASSNDARGFESIKLTPPLVLSIALMYIIASDGRVDAAESSQIQSVIGHNEDLVRFASQYVRGVALSDFLARSSQGLSQRDKMCILANVCDAMLADGQVQEVEQKTLQLLLRAFEIPKRDFDKYSDALSFKNDKSVLGRFRLGAAQSAMTPHLALAVAVLYMMSADGNIDKHEIGRLETLVADFEGLQKTAISYVKQTKRERFIQEAAYALTEDQKTFILLNVYDAMTSDGVIAVSEDKIFAALVTAFGQSPSDFAWHIKVIEDKNLKPFDLRKVNVDQLFEQITDVAQRTQVASHVSGAASLGELVSRTMQDNVAVVTKDFGSESNVIQIQGNATNALNLQKVDAANDAMHRVTLDSEAANENRVMLRPDAFSAHQEKIQGLAPTANVQVLDATAIQVHMEVIGGDASDQGRVRLPGDRSQANRQTLTSQATSRNMQRIPSEVRIENLFEDIESLHEQLTEFERRNKSWLNLGKVFRQNEEAVQQEVTTNSDLSSLELSRVDSDVRHRLRGAWGYTGRAFDVPTKRTHLGLKEILVALALTVCVTNLGASKPITIQGVQGVLIKLNHTPR